MRTEPELLNERLDRLALVLDEIMPNCANLVRDALALLKEQEAAYQGAVELLWQKTILFDDAIKRLKEQEEQLKNRDESLEKAREEIKWLRGMLKEQEAIKPIAKEDDTFECVCGAVVGWEELDSSGIVTTHFNYCPFCGKAVKWE